MKTDLTGSWEADDTPLVPGSTHEEWHPYSVWRDKIRRDNDPLVDSGSQDHEIDSGLGHTVTQT